MQEENGVTAMIYPPNISSFVDDSSRKILTNFASVILNTQVKSLNSDGYICTFTNAMLALILHHNKALKFVSLEANITTVTLL